MHLHHLRSAACAAAVVVAAGAAGSLVWAPAPAVAAQTTPTALPVSATPTMQKSVTSATPAAPGGVEIHTQATSGQVVAGAAFALRNGSTGTVVAEGTTDSRGIHTFDGLPPGVYRLQETSTGDTIHVPAADEDVIIAEGQDAAAHPLTVIDPFKPAALIVRTTSPTGTPLSGARVTISADTVTRSGTHTPGATVVTLTTSRDGTARAQFSVRLTSGTTYWATDAKALHGYRLNATVHRITARPGATVGITLTDTPTAASPTKLHTHTRTTAEADQARIQPPASLAHTGAGDSPWLLGSAAVLVAAGGTAMWAGRRRTTTTHHPRHR